MRIAAAAIFESRDVANLRLAHTVCIRNDRIKFLHENRDFVVRAEINRCFVDSRSCNRNQTSPNRVRCALSRGTI